MMNLEQRTAASEAIALGNGKITYAVVFNAEERETQIRLGIDVLDMPLFVGVKQIADFLRPLTGKNFHEEHLMLLEGASVSWSNGTLLVPGVVYLNRKGEEFSVERERYDYQAFGLVIKFRELYEFSRQIVTTASSILYNPDMQVIKREVVKPVTLEDADEPVFDEPQTTKQRGKVPVTETLLGTE